jgi:hypothetical protein
MAEHLWLFRISGRNTMIKSLLSKSASVAALVVALGASSAQAVEVDIKTTVFGVGYEFGMMSFTGDLVLSAIADSGGVAPLEYDGGAGLETSDALSLNSLTLALGGMAFGPIALDPGDAFMTLNLLPGGSDVELGLAVDVPGDGTGTPQLLGLVVVPGAFTRDPVFSYVTSGLASLEAPLPLDLRPFGLDLVITDFGSDAEFSITAAAVPLPATLPLVAAGLGALALIARRRAS